MRRAHLLLLISIVFAFGSRPRAQNSGATLKKIAEFDVPGPPGERFDYLAIDPADHYLISAHLAAWQTYVIDLRTNKVVATVADTPGARKVYVNLPDENIFAVIDPATDEVIGRYPVGRCKSNHGMTLDPEHHRAFLSCEGNNPMTVFDLDKHEPIAFLAVADDPDVIKFDPGLGRIYAACYSGAISLFHQDDPQHYRKVEDCKVQHAVHSLACGRGKTPGLHARARRERKTHGTHGRA